MEARIEELMGVIKKKIIEEILYYGPESRQLAAEAAGVQQRQSNRSRSPQQNKQVKDSLKEIKQQIRRINNSLRTIQERQTKDNKQQNQYRYSTKQLQHKRSDTTGNIQYKKHIRTYMGPSHLNDNQVKQALYNPELASSETIRREKRRSNYDQIYEESERRIDELAKSVGLRRGRSKISSLIDHDRKRGQSRTPKSHLVEDD